MSTTSNHRRTPYAVAVALVAVGVALSVPGPAHARAHPVQHNARVAEYLLHTSPSGGQNATVAERRAG